MELINQFVASPSAGGSTVLPAPAADEVGPSGTFFPGVVDMEYGTPGFGGIDLSWLDKPFINVGELRLPRKTETFEQSGLNGVGAYLSEGNDDAHNVANYQKYKEWLRDTAKPKYKVSNKPDGSIRFKYGNVNKQHGIDGTLSPDGTWRFEVQAHQDPSSELRIRLGSGAEMFDEMISVIGMENIKQIEGIWSKSSGLTTNLDQFYENRQFFRMDQFEAAENTWTGSQAAKYGYTPTKVTIVSDGIRVIFGK